MEELPNTERAVRRPGGPEGLAVCDEAGPYGYDLDRLLSEIGVAGDIVASAESP